MILRLFFILLFLWLCVKAQETETSTTTTTFTTTTEIPGTTKNPCPGKNSSECVKNMIFKMSDNLAINRLLNLSQPHCRDFWGRKGISRNGICIYVQVIRMTKDKNGTMNSTQYLNLNPYYPNTFWHQLFEIYNLSDIEHFQKIVKQCNKLRNPNSEKANGCFKDPKTDAEILVFPQCFNEVTKVTNNRRWRIFISRGLESSLIPLDRVKTCNYHMHLGVFPNTTKQWIGFGSPSCSALDLKRTCYMGLILKENKSGFYKLWCCQKSAQNITELLDGRAHGSVYSPLAEMFFDMARSQEKMGGRGLCAGAIDVDQKICATSFNLVNFPNPIFIEPDFNHSIVIIDENFYNCSIVWTKNTSLIPVVRCICDYEVKKMCDQEVIKDFDNSFVLRVKNKMMKTHCDQPASEIPRSIVVGCQIVMDIKDNYIAIHPGPVQGNEATTLYDIQTNECEQSDNNETITCFCRANYTGNDFCNTIGTFQKQYQKLITILQTRSNFTNPVTLYHTDCVKNFKKLSVDLKSKFIGTTSRILCYSSNYGTQREKDTEYYDQYKEKSSEEKGVYLPGQVNENIKVIPRIACDMFFDETLDSNLVDGCKCLISTSDILKKKPLYCCCHPNKIQ